MTFSKEDKAAWDSSEVMRELEKLAEDVLKGTPDEAHLPIMEGEEESSEDTTWEDEDLGEKGEEALVDVLKDLENEDATSIEEPTEEPTEELSDGKSDKEFMDELLGAYSSTLLHKMKKLAHNLVDTSKIEAAYKVERAMQAIQSMLREDDDA